MREEPAAGAGAWPLLLAASLSGCAALVYEVVWLRPVSVVVGHTVGAVTVMLTAFLAGLGLGSAGAATVFVSGRDVRSRRRAYAGLELAVAVVGLSFPFLAPHAVPATGNLRLPV